MAERVKVYEETKKGLPIWAWLLPLLLLLALPPRLLPYAAPQSARRCDVHSCGCAACRGCFP